MSLTRFITYLLLLFVLAACLGNSTQNTKKVIGDEVGEVTLTQFIQTVTPHKMSEQKITLTPKPTINTIILEPVVSPTDFKLQRLCSPLAGHTLGEIKEIVSAPYDPPPMGRDERHQGVDLAYYRRGERVTIQGVEVQVILPGRVVSVIKEGIPYGNMVIIETIFDQLPPMILSAIDISPRESLYHLYAHLGETPEVELGDQVACGQRLGEVGKTGYNIVNPHLHLETRLGPSAVSFQVMSFYNTRATHEEMENYRLWRMSGEFRHFDPLTLVRVYLGE